ncbi:competence/damage-inducible protein A [Metabacillus rhizolycopersici]|uniref:Putative competence-damage inducible protein n=1 Tax=Metabacillus rhizolycopersici TaxID=2875709 RepID=A0ABS7UQD1_9BACI|nr:competence/damage-inducible protein A [Metabacillus rhizolycopersici]MBZ5750501.1 competence/damage-inducible protein A [Metabacillus rhizolycopersici]
MNVRTEIIAVGSELLLGQIVNSNAQFLSSQLADLGMNVYYHTVVGDNSARLEQAIKIAQDRSNVIIFTGGLGPTKDDLTKETISRTIGKELVFDQEALEYIEQYFVQTKRIMSENNKKQALVLDGANILKNDYGMAPGMALEVDGTIYMLLPGPPKEMKPMFQNYGRTYFQNQLGFQEKITSRVLRYFGIGESQLETDIQDIIDEQVNPTVAPLAGDGEVTLRLTAKHVDENIANQLLNDLEQKINARVGEFFYGYEQTTLAKELTKLLVEKGKTISAAESLTGGMFSEQITALDGASQFLKGSIVCYTNEMKAQVLNVSIDTLAKFGAVSEQCAKEMAEQIRKLAKSDIGISFTGVAGPKPHEGQPVGTVFIGIATQGHETQVYKFHFAGTRNGIRVRTVKYGCHYLVKLLTEIE